jgi:hypothetical protein
LKEQTDARKGADMALTGWVRAWRGKEERWPEILVFTV